MRHGSGVDGALAQLRPSLAATASVGAPYYSGEVMLTIPLFDGGLAKSQFARCQAGAAAAAPGAGRRSAERPPGRADRLAGADTRARSIQADFQTQVAAARAAA